jgi:hypothetical protein
MAPRRKQPQNVGELDFSKRLVDSLNQPRHPEPIGDRAPMLGEQVRVGSSDTIWTILSVSYSGKEVNLHIPNTSLQRFRVMVADLVYIENPLPTKPKEPEKPEIDKEDVHEHLVSAQHSTMHHFEGDIATLKRYFKSKGLPSSTADELDELRMDIEDRWSGSIESIMDKLGEIGLSRLPE